MDFIDDKIREICRVLRDMIDETVFEISNVEYVPCGYKEGNEPPADAQWQPYGQGDRIDGTDRHFWFRASFRTPKASDYKYPILEAETDWSVTNPQGLLYLNGEMVQGIDSNHRQAMLEYDKNYDMYFYLYKGYKEGANEIRFSVKLADERIEKLYYDLSVPYNAMLCLDKNDYNRVQIKRELELALQRLDLRKPKSDAFYKSVEETIVYLDKNFYNGICGRSDAVVSCVGHTHIDVAYLWTLAQTKEKVQRSFSTVLALMKKYPEYIFMSSQPQLYKYLKETAPEVYAQVKEMVRLGRWEAEGAMWLEADCNLTSGESLVRQIMYGKRFMKEEFGVDSKVLWLPDVFGYSAALPQILKKSGVEKFVTSKISWSETDKMPYDTFMWEGIDGTEVFAYLMTARSCDWVEKAGESTFYTTYNGNITPQFIKGTWDRYQHKEYNNDVLISFGYGDGGGGPTADMLEQQRRLAYGIPGLPRSQMSSAADFLERAEHNFAENCKKLRRTPKWVGELYIERHRGTFTSVAKNKRNNRKSENMYQLAEKLCVSDMLLLGGEYPADNINSSWETILLNQFHDIIPGSSIFEVYEDSDLQYAQIMKTGAEIIDGKIGRIAANVQTDGGILVYNPNTYTVSGAAETAEGFIYAENIPALGWRVIKPQPTSGGVTVGENIIENHYLRVSFNENGTIASIYDKEYDREVIKQGECANELQIFEDIPRDHDAWEISSFYKDKQWTIDELASVKKLYEGERAGLEIVRNFQDSVIVQRIYLYAHSRRIDFVTDCDWHERHILLKAAFPLNIHTNKAVYDIQFGNIERPTHQNTSWDEARFEVCAHKWADMSEDGYGVSLLNDCKYGYSAEGSTLKLSLIKCATYPNREADQGRHSFTYSLLPHSGDFKAGGTIREAYLLNNPLITRSIYPQHGVLPQMYSLLSCRNENIVIETVKKAEESDEVIVRLYECFNRSGKITLDFGFDVKKAYVCDLCENVISELDVAANSVTAYAKGYEIVTVKLRV